MQPSVSPDWRPVAFKEWQLISDAIASGEQSVILRKGGISEGKAGFQWIHDRFFLFPSLFHEQPVQVTPLPDGTLRAFVPREGLAEDDVVFSVYIETVAMGRITDWEEVLGLAPYHIWREEIVRERFEWGDEPGLSWAAVRAWELEEPWILKDRATFGGCRSWFGLPADEGGDWRDRLAAAREITPRCGLPDWLI
ncbi:MAG: DUF1802 family protein [Verrucomicrobiales bacterium]|nr:DUF1802 family protein [Verrucomicrobiales bacterium]